MLLRPEVRITLVLVYTGASRLGDHVSDLLNRYLGRQNNLGDTDVFTSEIFDLRRVYAHLDPGVPQGSASGERKARRRVPTAAL
jgi:hypothetical protein